MEHYFTIHAIFKLFEFFVAERKIPELTGKFRSRPEISVADLKILPQGMKHSLQCQQWEFPLVVMENYVAKFFYDKFF